VSGFAPPDFDARRLEYQRELAANARREIAGRAIIQEAYEKYAHLDMLLSDIEWGDGSIQWHILHDLWQAIRTACAPVQPEGGVPRPDPVLTNE
jgi:hypothetical protein